MSEKELGFIRELDERTLNLNERVSRIEKELGIQAVEPAPAVAVEPVAPVEPPKTLAEILRT